MGCDWYDVKSICAFGTIVELNLDEFFEKMKNSEDLDFLLFSDCETGSLKDLKVKLFVYDKKTFFINQISMPGSYSIELSEHSTSIKEVPNSYPLNSVFSETTMDYSFTPSFINILTTMGVGILGKNKESPNKKLKTFETIELYKKYFGYDE